MEKNYDNLNEKELDYLLDTDFLISKHTISNKIQGLLLNVESRIHAYIKNHNLKFPDPVLIKAGKISKGENYLLLPYIILDYPRYFNKEGVFAYRTMFWWGKFYSCTLHLQGSMLAPFRANIDNRIELLKNHDFYIATSDSPWDYVYNKANYQLLKTVDAESLKHLIENKPFIKLSRYIKIEQHRELPDFAEETFALMMRCLGLLP